MAKPSMKPRRPARNTSQPPSTTRGGRGGGGPRHRSASPGSSPVAARKTQFSSSQPTPVPQQETSTGTGNRKIAKKMGMARGRNVMSGSRGRRNEEEDEEGEGEGDEEEEEEEEEQDNSQQQQQQQQEEEEERDDMEELIELHRSAEQKQQKQRGRLSLSFVPEDSEADAEANRRKENQVEQQEQEELASSSPNPPKYESPPNLLPQDDTVTSASLISAFFSTPEPDLSNTQIEVEELDVDLMLEMFPHLSAHSRKILGLLVLEFPARDLRRLLLVPGSSASKRLRIYEQNFAASKTPYGTSEYLSISLIESALGRDEGFRPFLHTINLSILADVAYTSQGSGESTFNKLKSIETDFPAQFGDVVRNANFQVALDLRTQYLVLALVNNQDTDGFDPDMWLRLIFFEDDKIKRWKEMEDVDNWEIRVRERVVEIRSTFGQKSYDDPLDVAMLLDLFPWDDFVKRISGYIKTRFYELEKLCAGKNIEDFIKSFKNPQFGGARESDLLDDRKIPEALQDGTPGKSRPAPVSRWLPGAGTEAVASTAPAVAADFESFESYKLRKEQQGHGRLGSASVAINAAQMKDLKRRKTMPAPETVPFVRGTPRVATSLGSKDVEVITMSQVKFLKCLKNAPEKTLGEAGTSRLLEAAGEAVASKQAEAEVSEPVEDAQPLEDEGDNSGVSNPVRWMTAVKKGKEMKNKENDKSVASTLPPPQQPRLMKRKRFIDPQEGASRVSQIDDDNHRASAKRQQLQKGREREVIPEELEESRPAFEDEDEDEQDEDADAEMYEVDSRKEDEERTKRSRKGLPDFAAKAPAASAAPRTRKIAPKKSTRNSKGSRAAGGTKGSRELSVASEKSDVDEYNSGDKEYGEEEEVEEFEDDEESVNNDERRAALNQRVERIIKKDLEKQSKPERQIQKRRAWGQKQTALLIRIIGEKGCKWAEIRDMNVYEFSGRSNIQLKDKARNIKYDYLKARLQLPPNFEDVTISRTQVQTLRQMGINCDDYI